MISNQILLPWKHNSVPETFARGAAMHIPPPPHSYAQFPVFRDQDMCERAHTGRTAERHKRQAAQLTRAERRPVSLLGGLRTSEQRSWKDRRLAWMPVIDSKAELGNRLLFAPTRSVEPRVRGMLAVGIRRMT